MKTDDRSHIGTGVVRTARMFSSGDLVGCAMTLWPLIDSTAKVETGENGVGARIRTFLNAYDAIITYVALGSVFSQSMTNDRTIFDVLYNECRNSILHEGREAPIIEWTTNGALAFGIGQNPNASQTHRLPQEILFGLIIAVVLAPCNENAGPVGPDHGMVLGHLGTSHELDDLWGQRDQVMQKIRTRFRLQC